MKDDNKPMAQWSCPFCKQAVPECVKDKSKFYILCHECKGRGPVKNAELDAWMAWTRSTEWIIRH